MRRACDSTVRSTEAIAQPAARRPCGHEPSETPTRTRPKSTQIYPNPNSSHSPLHTHQKT
ncbi:MAG: hypothetical protein NZ455_08475 [Bacteroidia bacterium]|nr:hypothetical protein [Bacteroidia bacterium]MDW8345802.1 hypothetical protein [Bacteroidia bacterium]